VLWEQCFLTSILLNTSAKLILFIRAINHPLGKMLFYTSSFLLIHFISPITIKPWDFSRCLNQILSSLTAYCLSGLSHNSDIKYQSRKVEKQLISCPFIDLPAPFSTEVSPAVWLIIPIRTCSFKCFFRLLFVFKVSYFLSRLNQISLNVKERIEMQAGKLISAPTLADSGSYLMEDPARSLIILNGPRWSEFRRGAVF